MLMKKNSFLLIVALLAVTVASHAQKFARGLDTDLWGNPTLSDYKEAKSLGFDYIELDPGVYGSGSYASIVNGSQSTKNMIDEANLKVWSAHLPYGNSYDISVVNESSRKGIVNSLKNYIRALAEVFGPKVVVLHPSGEPVPDNEREQRIANATESIRELYQTAKEAGVTLCVENLPRTCLGNTPEELLRIVEPVEGVKICFDTNHYLLGTTEHFFRTIGHLIGTIHASDYDYTNEKHWFPTYGKIAWGELMMQLEATGYDGVFMSEAEQLPSGTPTVRGLKEAYDAIFEEYERVKNDPSKRTEAYLDGIKRQYFENTDIATAFPAGTAPGHYPVAVAQAFTDAYNTARQAVSETHTAEEYDALRLACYETLEALKPAVLPMVGGWYFIVSGHSGFAERGKTMAMYNTSDAMSWGPLERKASFLFKVTQRENGMFSIQNAQTECFINTVSGTSSVVPVSEKHMTDQLIKPFGQMGQFYIYNTQNPLPYHTAGHGEGNGNGGDIVTWNGVAGSGSSWYFQPVDDDEVKEILANKEEVAHLPEVSTEQAPLWYYIQIVGEEDRANRVYTSADGIHVTGQPMIISDDDNELGKQLWRFEQNASGNYTIVHKLSGKRLTVEFDEEQNSGCAMLSNSSTITFQLKRAGNYFQVISSKAAEGTSSSEIYLHQGNSGYDYNIITVGSYYGGSINSMTRFVPFEEFRFTYSDELTDSWYNIINCGEAFSGLCIKEEGNETSSQLILEAGVDDETAQWKAVKPASGKGVQWVNRASGRVIATNSEPFGLFNRLWTNTVVANENVWTTTYLGDKQYAFSTVEDDNVERYMGANSDQAEAAEELDLRKLANSSHAWVLRMVESVPTSIGQATETNHLTIRVIDRRIVVEGCTDFNIHTLSGMAMPTDLQLQPGIYIVSAQAKSTKIIVK